MSLPMISLLKSSVLELSDRSPIAQGRRQLVFEHPAAADTLIKVLKPHTYDGKGDLSRKRWFDRFRKASAYMPFKREFAEFVDLKAQYPEPGADLPLCYIQGLIQTDLGLGFIFEKIADPDGSLSETVFDIARRRGTTPRHLADLVPFFDMLEAHHVVLGDLNPKNVVYQRREDGSGRYVCVDGTGSKQAIPLRKWFKSQNTLKIRQTHAKFRRRLEAAMADPEEPSKAEVAAGRPSA